MIDRDETPEMEVPADPCPALLPGQELVPAYLTSRFAAQSATATVDEISRFARHSTGT